MTRLVLVRHGESNASVARVIGGPRTCNGLSPLGEAQARALANRFRGGAGPRPDALYASTMPRAVQTAQILAPVWGMGITQVDDLREHDPGPLVDGLTFEEYQTNYGSSRDWAEEPFLRGFEGGETLAAFQYRSALAVRRLVAKHREETVMVVCHGGVIDIVLRSLLGLPMFGSFYLYTANTSLTELLRPPVSDGEPLGMWHLLRYNDAAHLEPPWAGECTRAPSRSWGPETEVTAGIEPA